MLPPVSTAFAQTKNSESRGPILIGGGAQPTEMSRCKNTLSKVHVRTFVEVEFHPTSKNNRRRVSSFEICSALFMVYIEFASAISKLKCKVTAVKLSS
jgi:hypothetical protein